jgi:hypothetical protein
VAERQLSRRVAARAGESDVVQSAFRTFFRRNAGGQLRIANSCHLWLLLVRITVLKARAKARYHTAAARAVFAEVGDAAWLAEAAAREPGPAEAAALVDHIDALLRGLLAVYGRILELLLQGHTKTEVADELGLSRMTVYRALDVLQKRLRRLES